jgi:hypothetical protein
MVHAPKKQFNWREAWTKFPFLAFCWVAFAMLASFGAGLYLIIMGAVHYYSGSTQSLPQSLMVVQILVMVVVALPLFFIGAGLTLITLTALSGVDLLYPHNHPSLTVKYLFPVAVTLAQLFGFNRNHLRVSFVKTNNALTRAQAKRITGDRLLILLPHCLQIDVCNRKITNDISNCVRCGRCPVAKMLEYGERYGLKIEVVNGGTLARRKVASFRPHGIVAVACERDLTLGIQDVHPIPVFGVINDRPNGPCYNTEVDMQMVEEAIRFFKVKPATKQS